MAYTVNLTHRGPQVIECIDLFDEARYGADKLFFRKRCRTAKEIHDQVSIALGNDSILVLPEGKTKEDYGIGNPLSKEKSNDGTITIPTIALNRYHIPNKKFWNNDVPTDDDKSHRASMAVRFSIRVHFRDDYAYIDFGCPWEETKDFGGTLTDEPTTTYTDFINKFIFIKCHFISKEDALQILDSIFENMSANTLSYSVIRNVVTETTELIDEDGSIIAL